MFEVNKIGSFREIRLSGTLLPCDLQITEVLKPELTMSHGEKSLKGYYKAELLEPFASQAMDLGVMDGSDGYGTSWFFFFSEKLSGEALKTKLHEQGRVVFTQAKLSLMLKDGTIARHACALVNRDIVRRITKKNEQNKKAVERVETFEKIMNGSAPLRQGQIKSLVAKDPSNDFMRAFLKE